MENSWRGESIFDTPVYINTLLLLQLLQSGFEAAYMLVAVEQQHPSIYVLFECTVITGVEKCASQRSGGGEEEITAHHYHRLSTFIAQLLATIKEKATFRS